MKNRNSNNQNKKPPHKKTRKLRNKKGGNKRKSKGKKHTKNNNFKKLQCAPKVKKNTDNKGNYDDNIEEFSCYTKDALIKMKNVWNTRHKTSPITDTKSKDIWNSLKNKMKNACYNEYCWLKQKFMENNLNDKLTSYTFAPKSPPKWKEDPNTWLNSDDIEKVMKQYEHTYPCFRFIGPTPIDFDTHIYENKCVWDDLCKFDLLSYIKDGINKIGIIFNTDPHNKSGAHWISLFIDLNKKFIFFFDSNGTEIPKQVKEFCNRVISQGLQVKTQKYPNGIRLKYDLNAPFVHQESNTECGMYSLYLIVTLLKDIHKYTFFKKNKITDELMEKLRNKYFNSDM
jgi:hypothetical protein